MRVSIVSDITSEAEALRRTISSSRGHKVAWVARSGAQAVDKCAKERPDLILMDLVLPDMNGVEVTRKIMASTPCAIVVVTGSSGDNTASIFEAMGAGALDAITLPLINAAGHTDAGRLLIQKIDKLSRLVAPDTTSRQSTGSSGSQTGRLVAIGASAGGPAAIACVLEQLPHDFNAAVVVIQHVDPFFADSLTVWLNHHSKLPVRLAQEGDRLTPGQVLVAAREEHLIFTSPTRLGYTRVPLETSYRPSVDVFFKSVDHYWQGDVVAVLLTGMGRDGAEGMRLLRRTGHHTIAQDRRSSAVYGMPKAAADLDAATEILPLDKIGTRLAALISKT